MKYNSGGTDLSRLANELGVPASAAPRRGRGRAAPQG
ncbi:hypothetical protein ACWDPI_37515, partial [Streptomyces zhihengii]